MHLEVSELPVGEELDSVPRARKFATDVLRSWGAFDLVEDGELMVAELVTNAVLHAGGPSRLRMFRLLGGVRIEVADQSRTAPLLGAANGDTMTGRGMALVAALSRRWGVEPLGDGKVVWCELMRHNVEVVEPEPATDEASLDWDEELDDDERFTIHLGDVPTDLLLEAKAHVDNLVREFVLASRGAASGQTAAVPFQLAQLIESVVHGFSEARNAIKRQALAAAVRGDARTSLTLRLPLSSARAGEEYDAAIDEADAYARAARLLTLESPPQHRVFRHWYVESLVEQLRHAAPGTASPHVRTLEQYALSELDAVAAAQRTAERSARLQIVTAAFAAATTVEDVAAAVVSQGVSALGASAGTLLLRGDARLNVPGALGYTEPVVDRLKAEPPDAELPAALAIRSREPVWLDTIKASAGRFPDLADMEPSTVALCAVPVLLGDKALGALRFSFETPQLFDADDRRFIEALAAQTAQALDRCTMMTTEREARAQAEALAGTLGQLQLATAELSAARTVEEVAEMVVTRAADALGATLGALAVIERDGGTLRVVRMRGAQESSLRRWETFPVDANLPASEAVRDDRMVVAHGSAELERRYPALKGQTRSDWSLVCVPLSVGGRRLGVISLSFPADTPVDDPVRLRFLATLADASAQAIQRANALDQLQAAGAKLAFLAEASAELAGSLNYRATLSNVAALLVPQLADWCAVHVVEKGAIEALAVAHADPDRVAEARQAFEDYPIDPDGSTGIANVIRTGVSELYPEIPDEMLLAAAVDAKHLRMLRELGFSSALVVPMTGRTGTFGAIALVYAESGRRYSDEDLSLAKDLAHRAAIAMEHARAFSEQTGQLAAITRVAEAAQHAILAPVPPRVGPLQLSAAYVSAAKDALVGGDLYEVIAAPRSTRLLIADVRGKGLEAVRTATVVLGEFRSLAMDLDDLAELARQMDRRLRPYLEEEDFVTALLAEIRDDGTGTLACCGHPPALIASGSSISELGPCESPPLGLGADPTVVDFRLAPGDRILLFTDGLLEARDENGRFVDVGKVSAPLGEGALDTVLWRILNELTSATGPDLGDDLALLVAEYQPG